MKKDLSPVEQIEYYLGKDGFKDVYFKREGQVTHIKNLLWTDEIKIFPYGIAILIQSIEWKLSLQNIFRNSKLAKT